MSLSLNSSPLVAALAAAIALVVTVLYYRRTVPPIPRSRKVVLSALRFLGLFLLFLFLLEPVLHNAFSTTVPPRVAVLVDNSQSMMITDATGDRVQKEKDVIHAAQQSRVAGDVQSYLFGDSVHPRPLDSLGSFSATGSTTNVSAALNTIEKTRSEQNVQAVVLVTDGEYTAGEDPRSTADNIPVPIYTVGIGDSSEQRDIRINSVITNDVALLGATIPIEVAVHSKGFDNQQVSITLTDDNQPSGTQQIMLHASTEDYSCAFTVTPKTAGTHKFRVAVTALAGELTDKNNSKIFFVRVIDNKVKVALFAGAPGPDVSFVMQTLAANENATVTPFIQKDAGEFYVNPLTSSDFTNADCIVMVGFPIGSTNNDVIHAIAERAGQKNVPLFIVWGKDVAPAKLSELNPYLPFSVSGAHPQEQLLSMHVGADALIDPAMRLTGTARDSGEWNSLPPTFYYESLFRQKPEANLLATMRLFNNITREPMILSEHLGAMKSMAILTYGIWRWRLLGKGSADVLSRNGATIDVFTTFINNTLQWLTAKDDEKQVHVRPVKQIFTPSENVQFVGQAYDEKYSPVDNATVDVNITNGQQTYSISLAPNGNGQYLGGLSGLAQGDYNYQGKVTLGDKTLGEESGKFSVTDAGIEFQNTRMDAGLLQAVALKTGGIFTTPERAAALFDSIAAKKSFAPLSIEHKKEFELWTNVWMLAAALGCLCVEWFLRKRSGLL